MGVRKQTFVERGSGTEACDVTRTVPRKALEEVPVGHCHVQRPWSRKGWPCWGGTKRDRGGDEGGEGGGAS